MAEEGSWDTTIQEWLIDEGYCCAGALAYLESGEMYAAAPVADEAGWGLVYKEDHEEDIMQDDMSTKKVTINEQSCFLEAAKGGRPVNGLWIGGEKYTITQTSDETVGDTDVKVVMANRPKKGLCIVPTSSQIVIALYNEEAAATQNAGNCKKTALAFAEYLIGAGY
mmetsp:Transcript_136370/g.345314  ORF Transcript_136370/g.345314 Transcript_136370/m.345314 type:complete len:167 (+) Transcript_136370:80-580(+)